MKQNHRRALSLVVALALGCLGAGSALAYSINFTVAGTGPMHFPGPVTPPANAPWGPNGYPGDTVELEGLNSVLNFSGPTSFVQKIGVLKWTIDYTYAGTATDPNDWSDLAFDVNGGRGMTVGSSAGTLSQMGLLEVTWDNDFLTLLQGSTQVFVVDRHRIAVTPLGLAREGGSNFAGGNPWVQPNRDIMGRFDIEDVPEPSAFATGSMLLSFFGAIKLRLLRRKRNS